LGRLIDWAGWAASAAVFFGSLAGLFSNGANKRDERSQRREGQSAQTKMTPWLSGDRLIRIHDKKHERVNGTE
jgi:hypothetical protein